MFGNDRVNRNVLSSRRNSGSDSTTVMFAGRLFQMVVPATEKARLPTVRRRANGTSSLLELADRKARRDGMSATRVNNDVR